MRGSYGISWSKNNPTGREILELPDINSTQSRYIKEIGWACRQKACVLGDKVPVVSFYNEFSNTIEDRNTAEDPKEFIFVHTVKQR